MNVMTVGGQDWDLTAVVKDAGTSTINSFAWQSSATGVATVTGNGATATVHAVGAGTATITLTVGTSVGDKTHTWAVRVRAAQVVSVAIAGTGPSSGGFPNDPGGIMQSPDNPNPQ